MKLGEKVAAVVLGLLIFFFSGGIACTYSSAGQVNLVLAAILGAVVFIAAGFTACTVGGRRAEKRKASQIAP